MEKDVLCIDDSSSASFSATNQLRWHINVIDVDGVPFQGSRHLQQCWISDTGKKEWRDIEIVFSNDK